MTTAAEATAPAQAPDVPDTETPRRRWQPWALALIVLGSAALYAWNITGTGWGNTFYTAAVKSMSESLTNFVFGSFDPAGVVTVDKPPMALWPQVVSVWVFGWHSWAVLLPQVVEGAAAVFLLHRTVRYWAGENVALVAALVLAITPITVAINRDNNPDTMLTLLCVAAAYAFTRSVQPGASSRSATKWLLQAAFWVGCGFLTKSLAAWMIVPALAVGYLFGREASWGRRIGDLFAAAGVLLVSSFWWVALTVLWPDPKPYVGGSTDGSELTLIFGYNGLGRVFGENIGRGGAGGGNAMARAPEAIGQGGPGGPGGGGFAADNGIGRMFGEQVGGQISWLLPLCLLVLVVVAVTGVLTRRRKLPADHLARAGWLMWGTWLVVLCAVFSVQEGIFHPYYTTQLAPAIGALAGAGLALLWRRYRDTDTGWSWVLLPLAVALTAAWAWVLVSRDLDWNGWLRYAVAGVAVLAVVGLVIARLTRQQRADGARTAAVLGLVTVLLAPGVWSAATAGASTGGGGAMASAGPPGGGFGGFGGGRGRGGQRGEPQGLQLPNGQEIGPEQLQELASRFGGGGEQVALTAEEQKILNYVTTNSGEAKIVMAVEGGSMGSSRYIINSNATIIGMGGFMGSDPAPSVRQLTDWKAQGAIAFVLTSAKGESGRGGRGGFGGGQVGQERTEWVQNNCKEVAPSTYGGSAASSTQDRQGGPGNPFGGGQTLYDCRNR
ncbi:glycosyltransferase family 39 protein [Kutzneria viridogrisea]|uniref:4-amino-4-deoxy-L-arabinose transferase-like glycosyltransferase n=1 Tax=Kutzneria viridogrisea TaxID=47990 RepID=A0ABR6BLA5_9PSEU|nr:4-amino-4-deoxy-L-arabinose transferase-like glycosyltransferase [Kutzneria viridogrisea]